MVSKSGRTTNFSRRKTFNGGIGKRISRSKKVKDITTKKVAKSPNGIKRKLKLQSKKERNLQRKTSGGKALSDVEVNRGKEANDPKKERKEG